MRAKTTLAGRSVRGAVAVVLVALLALPAASHNNAVVHPEITDAGLTLLRIEDMLASGMTPPVDPNATCDDCAYNELWENKGPLRPMLPRNDANAGNDHNYQNAFDAGDADVILGAVIEDGWNLASIVVVFNHFFHGRSGAGLLGINDSSRVRAGTLFEYGLSLHDYTMQSRQRSYFYLGRFLHHVEDMSSPAHVHNDPHIPTSEDEHDDYEGRYVPEALWVNSLLRPILDSASGSRAVDSGRDVWPDTPAGGAPPPDAALAGYVYNRTNYFATLQFPTFSDPTGPATGELAQMFPDDPSDVNNGGLRYDDGGMFGLAFWVIDGIGPYNYKNVFGGDGDTWWPDAIADEDGTTDEPDGVQGPYYIENLNPGTTVAEAVIPPRHRQSFLQPWNATTNPVVPNRVCAGGTNDGNPCFRSAEDCPGGGVCFGESILERQRDTLLTPPVEFVAGAARWWYRIANLPPYVERVEALQGTPLEFKYEAEWHDVVEQEERELAEIGVVPNTDEEIDVVTERTLTHVPSDRKYINDRSDLTLTLEFNEPIGDISELKLKTAAGADVLDIKAAVAAQASNNEPTKEAEDTRWVYLIEAATLQAVTDLNGELTLSVKATDKNEHWNGQGGELDGTPQTPAKRNLTGGFIDPVYAWHTDATDERFAYDPDDGDRTHRLLFDTEPPNTTIQVTP